MNHEMHHVSRVLNAGSSTIKCSLYDADLRPQTLPVCLGQGVFEVQQGVEHLTFRATDSDQSQHAQWPWVDEPAGGQTLLRANANQRP